MNLHQILKTVPPQYHAIARHYVRTFRDAGVPADRIDQLIQWGVSYTGSREEADILASFRQQASRLGLSDDVTAFAADRGLEAREQINSGKWKPEPQQPSDDAQILADIRRYRQQWPEAYEQDSDMQAAELALISASLGEKPNKPTQLASVSDADMRLKEIRQMRRDDPHAYETNPALQREELGLIEAQLASQRRAEGMQNVHSANELQPAPAATGSQGETNESV